VGRSVILLTFPGAQILSFDAAALRQTTLEDTSHFQITKGILQNPAVYWRHLQESEGHQNEAISKRRKSQAQPK